MKITKNMKAETVANAIVAGFVARRATFSQMVADGVKPVMSTEYRDIAKRLEGQSFIATIDKVKSMFDLQYFATAIANADNTKGNDESYMQLKTIVKTLKFFNAIALNDYNKLDHYTYYLLHNALKNHGSLSAHACFVTLSKKSMSDEDISEILSKYMNATAGTTSTQTSSTKDMLRALNMTTHTKGQRYAGIQLTDDAIALLSEHFASLSV